MKNFLFSLATLMADETTTNGDKWKWVTDITSFLRTLLPYVLIVVATAGTIYAVILGVKMARAEDASAREEAKKRIINFIIALAVTVVLILLLQLFATYLPDWLGVKLPEDTIVGNKTNTMIGLLK